MTQVRVKICGISEARGLEATLAAGADWLGFVFHAPSPRAVTIDRAAALSRRAGSAAGQVALFVAPSDGQIAAVLAAFRPAALQLHDVSRFRAAEIRRRFGVPVWHAVGVATPADLPRDADGIDAMLLDAKAPPDGAQPGGNARAFDWTVLSGWSPPGPWLLAGGLTPDNVAGAIAATGATAVDVSSGVEQARGVKDPDRIAAFVRAVRQAVSRSSVH